MERLQQALSSLKLLRISVTESLICLANGVSEEHGEENKEEAYLQQLQESFASLDRNFRDVEETINSLNAPPGPISLGNPAYLANEVSQELQELYGTVVKSYKWANRVENNSKLALHVLLRNPTQRSLSVSCIKSKRFDVQLGHTFTTDQFREMIAVLNGMYSDMKVCISKPSAGQAKVHVTSVTVGQVIKAVVTFQGVMIERVVIKGYNEKLDLWRDSRYKIFQRLTDHAQAMVLHYFDYRVPEKSTRSFYHWLHSQIRLGRDPCNRCGNYLYNGIPATWRGPESFEAYHFECK